MANLGRKASTALLALATWSCSTPPERTTRATSATASTQPTAALSASSAPSTVAAPDMIEVAVTVDDLPSHGPAFQGMDRVAIADRMLEAFETHHLPPVYGFVNAKRVDEHPETKEVLRRWVAAGNPLGNHTYGHVGLNDTPIDAYLADIDRGEAILRELVPDTRGWHFFRYPFLFEGPDLEKRNAVRAHLAAHDYTIAEVTIDGDDWAWNPPFARCKDAHDDAALAVLRAGYVKTHVEELRFMRRAMRQLVGREVRHVLLLTSAPRTQTRSTSSSPRSSAKASASSICRPRSRTQSTRSTQPARAALAPRSRMRSRGPVTRSWAKRPRAPRRTRWRRLAAEQSAASRRPRSPAHRGRTARAAASKSSAPWGRSSSHANATMRQPRSVRRSWVTFAPRPRKGSPRSTPDFS